MLFLSRKQLDDVMHKCKEVRLIVGVRVKQLDDVMFKGKRKCQS